jgi:hypothetical protein
VTTVNDPVCLEGYYENFLKFGHLDQVKVIVIPDLKTPQAAYDRCLDLRRKGMDIECPTVFDQDVFVRVCGVDSKMFPRNSDNRRNIGYLMALDHHVDFIISIDDDNYCQPEHDFFANHGLVVDGHAHRSEEAYTNWINPCDYLETNTGRRIYQRGFPYAKRWQTPVTHSSQGGPVHVNQGLWLLDPDVDAISWLANPCDSKGIKYKDSVLVVGRGSWAPVNSQNTAIRAEALPAYYFLPMITNMMDRFGDIFQGYFLQKCMKHMGGLLRVGTPVVMHKRNSHEYLKDLSLEIPAIQVLERMLPWLTESCPVVGTDYCEVYECLAERIEEWGRGDGMRQWPLIAHWPENMKQWAKVCRTIIGSTRGASV